jgi:hypothetical protein
VAVLEVFRTTDPTKATVWAMIGLLVVSHPQITDTAVIFPKLSTTRRIDTLISVSNSQFIRFTKTKKKNENGRRKTKDVME